MPGFGPVLYYDMIRSARRIRTFLVRSLYALGLLILLGLIYGSMFEGRTEAALADPNEMTQFAEAFFTTFMSMQFILVLLLTPAYVAGAIAEEKERRTLEYMMATDLTSREIILSKLVSRIANLFYFLLVGLPVLSLMQLFGGIDPTLLWCGFAFTALTVLSVACLSILMSVYARRARDAIIRTAMIVVAYFVLTFLLFLLEQYLAVGIRMTDTFVFLPGWLDWEITPTALLREINVYVNYGNVFAVLGTLGTKAAMGAGGISTYLLSALGEYAVFHLSLAAVCLTWALLRLRPVFRQQTFGTTIGPKSVKAARRRRLPPLRGAPMIWKERFAERGGRATIASRVFFALMAIASLAPFALILNEFTRQGHFDLDMMSDATNVFVRIVGTTIACFLLIGIAIRAASGLGSERDRQCLDTLLSTPLTAHEILVGKWVGAIWHARSLFYLLLIVWLAGLTPMALSFLTLTEFPYNPGLDLLALPLLLLLLTVYGSLLASLGLYFSVAAKTTLRALMWTMGITFFIGGGHWFCVGFLAAMTRFETLLELATGFTPPVILGLAAFRPHDFDHVNSSLGNIMIFGALAVAISAFAAVILYAMAVAAFPIVTGRAEAASLAKAPPMLPPKSSRGE